MEVTPHDDNVESLPGPDRRLCFLEKRTKEQDDEISILKASLANVLFRLNTVEGEMRDASEKQRKERSMLRPPSASANRPSTPGISTRSHGNVPLRDKSSNKSSPVQRKLRGKSMNDLTQLEMYEDDEKEEGKTKLILSKSMSRHKPRAFNQPNTEENTQSKERFIGRPSSASAANRDLASNHPSTPGISTRSRGNIPLRDKSSNKSSPVQRKLRGKSMNDLSQLEMYDDDKKEDGKIKIILAKSMSRRKPNAFNESITEESTYSKDDSVKFNIRGRSMTFYPPTSYQSGSVDGTAPDVEINLKWVYGYRGTDCRDNLYDLPSGEIVYNMAGVVVLYSPKEDTQRHYTEHNDQVKCLALHPNNVIIASGQIAGHGENKKPHVLIWDSSTLQTLKSLGHNDFERGVCAVEFSTYENGKYLIAFDDSDNHVIYLYDWEKGTKITETNVSKAKLLGVKWNPSSELSFVTYGKTHLMFWNLCVEQHKIYLAKKSAIYDKLDNPKFVQTITYTNDGDLVSGDSNGNILLFKNDNKRNRVTKSASAHKGGVFCVRFLEKDGIILSCGKDGQISTWNINLDKLKDFAKVPDQYGYARSISYNDVEDIFFIGTSKNCILQYDSELSHETPLVQGHYEDIWGLAAHPTQPICASCAQDQMVFLWNCESMSHIWSDSVEEEASSAEFHPKLPYLLVGTKSGKIFFLNYERQEEDCTLSVSGDCIDDIKISLDGKWFAIGCRDSYIYVYAWPEDFTLVKKPKVLQGHSSRVLHLDWSVDGSHLQSSSSDYELLFWDRKSGSRILNSEALRDVSWATWTCTIGYPAIGIWPEGADGTDIKSCTRSNDNKLIATGDDFMSVKIFRYPCVKLKSESIVGTGHSSYVTCVRFLSNDGELVTVGGGDCSLMQWSIRERGKS